MQLQGREIAFVLCRQSLKDGWWTDTHIFIDKTMAGSLFFWDSLSVSAHLRSCFVPDSHLFPFTQMCKWEIWLDISSSRASLHQNMLLPLWLHLVCEKPDAIVARGCFSPEGRRQYSAVRRFSESTQVIVPQH